ncbi:MAG TPA: CBS domain-containing protein [Candidatus Sulfopaludibacter sp.]|nr:CBS domain-containing protein [Candidatus Sulfopaludibacter sp.]
MIVSMWMTRDVVTVQPKTPVIEAAELMADRRIRRLPVVEMHENGPHILGIVSARDILHAFPPGVNPFAVIAPKAGTAPTTVEHIMSSQLQTIAPEAPLEAAAELMAEYKVGALPVTRDGRLVGLITESDIFRAFASLFASPECSVRITFDISSGEDVFGWSSRETRRRKLRIISLITLEQDQVPVCVVRVAGINVEEFLEDLWNSGHRVLNVVRYPQSSSPR